MFPSSKQLAKSLMAMSQDKPIKQVVDNFVHFLSNKNLLYQLPNVVKQLEIEQKKIDEQNSLHIITSQKINNSTIDKIKKYINAPSDVPVKVTEDKNIIGGFMAKHNGKIYNASVRNQITRLKNQILN